MSGLILWSPLRNRFQIFTKRTPQVVAITNDSRPRTKIFTELPLRNLSACVEAPTVRPISVVTTSISGPRAVSARRLVTPLSFRRLPKKSMPRSGSPDGTMNAVRRKPTIGKMIFSFWLTCLAAGILMRRSFLVVSASMIGLWMTGTRAI